MSLPDPDSREYRALVLSGRLAALQDVANHFEALTDRLAAAEADQAELTMVANWRSLSDFLMDAGAEVKTDLALLKQS